MAAAVVERDTYGGSSSSSEDDANESIDEALLNQEYGIKERLIQQADLAMPDAHLFYVRLAPSPDDPEYHKAVHALSALEDCGMGMSIVDVRRVRLSQSRYEQTRKRKEYRKQYNLRPEVIAKRIRDKDDPVKQQKKKEYNARTETRERKKELQRTKNLLYANLAKYAPQIETASGADRQKIMAVISKECAKIAASTPAGKRTARRAFQAAAVEDKAKAMIAEARQEQ